MVISVFLLLVGFGGLILTANLFVEGAVKVAGILKWPTLLVSLTLVALGTSAPELVVSSVAAMKGSDIALSNVLGSNIINIALVAGFTGILSPILIKTSARKEIVIMVIVEAALILLLINGYVLSGTDGAILIILLAVFLYYTFKSKKTEAIADESSNESSSKLFKFLLALIPNEAFISAIFIISGLGGLIISGNIVVNSAVRIAKFYGMSEALIGATIVAIGTSLPELVTSLIAVFRKEYDVVLGNIVGSNILNILFILGLSAIISPLHFTQELWLQAGVMLLCAVLLLVFSFTNKVGKFAGIVLLGTYAAFIVISF